MCVHLSLHLYHLCTCAGNVLRRYKVHFSLEIICEPAAPTKVIEVQCAAQVSFENTLKWIFTDKHFHRHSYLVQTADEHNQSLSNLQKMPQLGLDG